MTHRAMTSRRTGIDAHTCNWTREDCRLGFLAIRDGVTTAQYFEQAATRLSGQVHQFVGLDEETESLDALIVIDPCLSWPLALKKARCPVIGYLIDVHQQLEVRLAYARYFDHVFIAQPDYLSAFQGLPHPSVHWLPLACDPRVHFVPGLDRNIDVGFVGKMGYPGTPRFDTLTRVLAHFATNDTTQGYMPAEMGSVYSRSKIVFNKSINGDVNMRVFEALASGALLVTDRIGNGLEQIGTAGEHFVTYDTADEAIETIHHYLSNDSERESIARRGQAHVFAHHTYAQRLATMLQTAANHSQTRAPARSASPKLEAVWRSECMRIQGAGLTDIAALVAECHWSTAMVTNSIAAAARGIVRPLRQRMRAVRWPA
jgi:hypothetical protein